MTRNARKSRIHLKSTILTKTQAFCGYERHEIWLTDDVEKVTCKHCLRELSKKAISGELDERNRAAASGNS